MSTIGNFTPNTKILSNTMNSKLNGLGDGTLDDTANSLAKMRKMTLQNFVSTGLVIPTSVNLTAIASSGEAIVNGKYVAPTASSKTYTASKDTYQDLKDDGTYAYVEVANNATSGMTITLNSDSTNALRIGKVVSSASAVTSVVQTGYDSLGNAMYSRLATIPLPATQTILTSETTAVTTFTDLATVGPQVTVLIGASGMAMVHIKVQTAGIAGFAMSGANTLAASDDMIFYHSATDSQCTTTFLMTGLNAGYTTFTMKYRSQTGTTGFLRRSIIVEPK